MADAEHVTQDGGVLKKVLVAGSGSPPPKGATVAVNYEGKLASTGEVFDASHGYPFKFILGKGEVIKGWDRGVATMRKGEKAVLTIKAKYGYGKAGAPPEIPPNATLIFEVELMGFETPKKTTNPDLERLQKLRKEREQGQ